MFSWLFSKKVLACDWTELDVNGDAEQEREVSSVNAYMVPGKHSPQTDDVSVLLLLRCA